MSTRDLFVKNARAQLEEWERELERIETRVQAGATLPGDAGDELEKDAAELRRLRADVLEELGAIERSDDEAWEDMKVGTEKALSAMQDSLASVRARVG